MSQLSQLDLNWIIARTPKIVKNAMIYQQAILAGGFIRSIISKEEVNDIDLFASSKDHAKHVANSILNDLNGIGDIFETDNAYTVRRLHDRPIQIIHRWTFLTLEEAVASFDFTIAQAGVKCAGSVNGHFTWESYCHPNYYQDLAAKRLIYTYPVREEEAGGSLLRVLKFAKKGYHIPLDSLGGVIGRLAQAVNLDKLPLHDRATGTTRTIEQAIAHVVTGLLREVDPDITSLDHGEHQ